jgi:hypothetical protein
MSDIKSMVRKVGGRFYTENLMSNPVQVRESVTMTVEQLNDFVRAVIEQCVSIIEPSLDETDNFEHYDFHNKCGVIETRLGVL